MRPVSSFLTQSGHRIGGSCCAHFDRHLIRAKFRQKFSRLSVPPKRVVKLVESHQHDISSALLVWWHPEQAVELRVACRAEGVRTVEINGLACKHLYRLGLRGRQFIVGKVRMEIQSRHVFEQPQAVNVPNRCERCDLLRPFDDRGTSPQRLCTGTLSAFISDRVYCPNRCWRGTRRSPWCLYSIWRCSMSSVKPTS